MNIDWQQACMQILAGVVDAEGVIFEEMWDRHGMPEDVKEEILRLFATYRESPQETATREQYPFAY